MLVKYATEEGGAVTKVFSSVEAALYWALAETKLHYIIEVKENGGTCCKD